MEKFVTALVVCSLTMTPIAALYALLSNRLKKIQSSKWRYYTWILIFGGYIALFKPDFGGAAVTLGFESENALDVAVAATGERKMMFFFDNVNIYSVIFIVWLIGFSLNIGIVLYKQYSFFKSIKRLSKPVPRSVKEKAGKIAAELGTAANFKSVTVSEISSPMVTGFFKSLLILPDRNFGERELHLILKHELVHLKRHDLFIKAFMLFCGALHWFNPFIRLFIRLAEREGELYCDETVMSGESEELKKLYCRSILNTASARQQSKCSLIPAVSSNFSFNKQDLKHRMEMILSFNKKYSLGIICVIILVLTLYTGTVVAFSDTVDDIGGDIAAATTLANTEVSPAETAYTADTDEIETSTATISETVVTEAFMTADTEGSYTFVTQP